MGYMIFFMFNHMESSSTKVDREDIMFEHPIQVDKESCLAISFSITSL